MARQKTVEKEPTEQTKKAKYTKHQLVKSKKYANYRDALNAILADGETYTLIQVDNALKQFYEGGKK
ncbi:hypothetical protein V6C27_02950 [Peptococcaceae bacterium 1198_IL3148]